MKKTSTISPRTMIVIVNHGTPDLAIDCLHSLEDEISSLPGTVVCIIDNTCDTVTCEQISREVCKQGWLDWVTVKPLVNNGGFGHGNNAAIGPALDQTTVPDYFILLNPDTKVHQGAMAELIKFMAANPVAGIAGSRLINRQGIVQCSAHRQHSPLSELNSAARLGILSRLLSRYVVSPPARDEAHLCDWVSGASMIVRREVFQAIGLLDEHYYLYFEDPDFCLRARQAGFEVWHVPQSCVTHLEGQATGIRQVHKARTSHWFESRRRFFIKSYGVTGLIAADVMWGLGRLALMFRRLLGLGAKDRTEPKRFVRDLILGDLKAIASGEIPKRQEQH